MPKEIRVEIGVNAEITIDAVGFSGPECEKATKFLEDALGETAERKKKPEYYRHNHSHGRQHLGQGGR